LLTAADDRNRKLGNKYEIVSKVRLSSKCRMISARKQGKDQSRTSKTCMHYFDFQVSDWTIFPD
jgi:hypothetical protein